MKKTYRTPKISVVYLSGVQTILAGSDPNFSMYNDEVEGTEALSKKRCYDLWVDDEY